MNGQLRTWILWTIAFAAVFVLSCWRVIDRLDEAKATNAIAALTALFTGFAASAALYVAYVRAKAIQDQVEVSRIEHAEAAKESRRQTLQTLYGDLFEVAMGAITGARKGTWTGFDEFRACMMQIVVHDSKAFGDRIVALQEQLGGLRDKADAGGTGDSELEDLRIEIRQAFANAIKDRIAAWAEEDSGGVRD